MNSNNGLFPKMKRGNSTYCNSKREYLLSSFLTPTLEAYKEIFERTSTNPTDYDSLRHKQAGQESPMGLSYDETIDENEDNVAGFHHVTGEASNVFICADNAKTHANRSVRDHEKQTAWTSFSTMSTRSIVESALEIANTKDLSLLQHRASRWSPNALYLSNLGGRRNISVRETFVDDLPKLYSRRPSL